MWRKENRPNVAARSRKVLPWLPLGLKSIFKADREAAGQVLKHQVSPRFCFLRSLWELPQGVKWRASAGGDHWGRRWPWLAFCLWMSGRYQILSSWWVDPKRWHSKTKGQLRPQTSDSTTRGNEMGTINKREGKSSRAQGDTSTFLSLDAR